MHISADRALRLSGNNFIHSNILIFLLPPISLHRRQAGLCALWLGVIGPVPVIGQANAGGLCPYALMSSQMCSSASSHQNHHMLTGCDHKPLASIPSLVKTATGGLCSSRLRSVVDGGWLCDLSVLLVQLNLL